MTAFWLFCIWCALLSINGTLQRRHKTSTMDDKIFETTDLGLASALVTCGYTVLGIRKDGKSGIFQFNDGVEVLAKDYFDGYLMGNLNKMMANIKNLKTMVNNTR